MKKILFAQCTLLLCFVDMLGSLTHENNQVTRVD